MVKSSSWALSSKSRRIALPAIADTNIVPTRVSTITARLITQGALRITLPVAPPKVAASVAVMKNPSRAITKTNT